MPKKYIVRNFNPGKPKHNQVNPLLNLSSLGINTDKDIIKSSLALGVTETTESQSNDNFAYGGKLVNSKFDKYRDITKNQTQSYAFFDMSYVQRRDYLRQFACDMEISFILDTVTNEAIVPDSNGMFAQLDLDKLKLAINKSYNNKETETDADKLIRDCKIAFSTVYSCYGWDHNNDGWNYFRKFLIDGYLAFEIVFDNPAKPTTIVAFKELDPSTLEPEIVHIDGKVTVIWYQYRNDAERQRIIPDANLIYISWSGVNFSSASRISYLEGLVRSFNMLRQLENAHCIWNIQNSQKQLKINVPVGSMTDAKARNRVSEIIADYNEEVSIDDASGEVTVNGYPKFSFSKLYVFPQREGTSTTIEEFGGDGYDMNTTESLQYFWRKFILESQVPANRFMLNISSPPSNPANVDSSVTREEYAFARFIQRIQSIFKELLQKPLWIMVCLMHPELTKVDFLRTCLGIKYNEENLFTLAKERQIASEGANTVTTLGGIMGVDQKPKFSMDWLIMKYMGLSDADLEANRQYKKREILEDIERQKLIKKHMEAQQQPGTQAAQPGADAGGFGGDAGGFGGDIDTGGGMDFGSFGDAGGADAGGFGDMADMGGGDAGGMEAAPADTGGFGDTEPGIE